MSALNPMNNFYFSENNVISISEIDLFADDLNDSNVYQITGSYTKHFAREEPAASSCKFGPNLANRLGAYPVTGQIVAL